MKSFIIAILIAASVQGCSEEQMQHDQQVYHATWYEVTKFSGDKPVERWHVHSFAYSTTDEDVRIFYGDLKIDIHGNVKVRNVSDSYNGPESHEALGAYSE